MNKKVKSKWIEALKSDNYKQGFFCMKPKQYSTVSNTPEENCFCAIGLLCELYRQEHPESSWTEEAVRLEDSVYGYGFQTTENNEPEYYNLPSEVLEWIEVRDEVVIYLDCNLYSMTEVNDDWEWSFKDIANYFEEELE